MEQVSQEADNPFVKTRLWVFARNASGEPSIAPLEIHCTAQEIEDGDHYTKAELTAKEMGYESPKAFDEKDPAGVLLAKLENGQSVRQQAEIPGPSPEEAEEGERIGLWSIPLTVDMSLSATILARGADRSEAIVHARDYAASHGFGLFSLDEGNYRGSSDFYVSDPEAVKQVDELSIGALAANSAPHALAVAPMPVGEPGESSGKPSGITKTEITLTILHDQGVDIRRCDLARLGMEIDTGDMLGQMKVVASNPVPKSRLEQEQIELGNDGSFFAGYLEDDEAEGGDSDDVSRASRARPSGG